MTKQTTSDEAILKFSSHLVATALIITDVATVLALSFDYVLPVLVAFPEVEATQALSALGILAFLVFIQALFLPAIAIQFGSLPEDS